MKLNIIVFRSRLMTFHFVAGGLIQLNHGGPQNLQYVVNAAFIASLFVDYMNATGVPGWYCGTQYTGADELHKFATSQVLHPYLYMNCIANFHFF